MSKTMKAEKQQFLKKLENTTSKKDTEELLKLANDLLNISPDDTELLHARAQLYVKLQELGKAINDYSTILSVNKNDKLATTHMMQLKSILKFKNTDIYSSPNTNFDPWLD